MSRWQIDRQGILTEDKEFRRNLINCLSGFKSLNLLGSKSTEGQENLAVFSQVFHIGASPPLIGILFRPDSVPRHSLSNIMATEKFTLNHVHQSFWQEAHHSGARWQESEFQGVGLKPEYMEGHAAPFVQAAKVKIGCSLAERVDLAINGTHLIIGAIELVVVEDESWLGADGFLDLEAAGSLTVSGLDRYHSTQALGRLSYPKPDHKPSQLD